MQKWSRYNYILNSSARGKFIYNSRTNSFTRINEALFNILDKKEIDLRLINDDIKSKLKELKVIVEEKEDDDYYYNKKFTKRCLGFSKKNLSLTIATTTHCNFRCPYCYEECSEKTSLTIEMCDKIVRFIENNDAKDVHIKWYGGEPLLNFKHIEYISNILKNKYKGKKITYSIITNGYLMDKGVVELFRKYKLTSFQVTIDGPKDIHNKTRILANGEGTFDKIVENLENAIKRLPNSICYIRVNLDKKNCYDYPMLHKYLKDKLNYENLYVYHSFIKEYGTKLPDCIQRKNEFSFHEDLINKYGIIDMNLYPKFDIGGCISDHINGFVIDPNGYLYKCWVDIGKQEKIVGTIDDNKYADNTQINLLSRYMVGVDMFNDDKCKKCCLLPVCNGGCNHDRINMRKDYCPMRPKDIGKYLELHYQQLKKTYE